MQDTKSKFLNQLDEPMLNFLRFYYSTIVLLSTRHSISLISFLLLRSPRRAFSRFLDGGLIANNPTMDLLTEIWRHNMVMGLVGRKEEQVQVSCVVSLGTGMKPIAEVSHVTCEQLSNWTSRGLWPRLRFSHLCFLLYIGSSYIYLRIFSLQMSECADAFFPDSFSIMGSLKAVQSAQSLFKVLVEEVSVSGLISQLHKFFFPFLIFPALIFNW